MHELHELCKKGDIELIKKYITNLNSNTNLNVNEKDNLSYTPFHWACRHGHIDVVRLLMVTQNFNSLNEKNNFGVSPFHWACSKGHTEIVELLIKMDGFSSLNEKDNHNNTSFLLVCENGHKEIVELLIKTNGFSSLNEKDNFGSTPFLLACANSHEEIVQELLKCRNIIVPDIIETKDTKIKELVERYKKDPKTVRSNLILKSNIDLYRNIVFLCDEYYKLNEKTENKNGLRFMKIASKLPLELQMTLIHRLSNSPKTVITSKQFDENIIEYIKGYLLKIEIMLYLNIRK